MNLPTRLIQKKQNIEHSEIDSNIGDLAPRKWRLIQVLERKFDQIYDSKYFRTSKWIQLHEDIFCADTIEVHSKSKRERVDIYEARNSFDSLNSDRQICPVTLRI